VTAASADARGSTLFEGPMRLHRTTHAAGTTVQAFIQVADRFGNACTPEPGALVVELDGPLGRKRLPPAPFSGDTAGHLSPRLDTESPTMGLFAVNDELNLTGRYSISASILGEEVVGSPLDLSIVPSPPDGEHCLLIPPPSAAIAHEPVTFVVQPRDRYNNTLPPSELDLAVAHGAVVARADGPTKPRCAVRARGDGSIDVTLVANLSGDYRLHVWVSGAQLPACPFSLRVHANRSTLRNAAEQAREAMAQGTPAPGPAQRVLPSPRKLALSPSSPVHNAGRSRSSAHTRSASAMSPLARGGVKALPRSPQSTIDLQPPAPHAPLFTPCTAQDPVHITAAEAPYDAPVPTFPSANVASASYLARQPATPRAREAARAAEERDEHRRPTGHGAQVTYAPASPPLSPRRHEARKAPTPRTSGMQSRTRPSLRASVSASAFPSKDWADKHSSISIGQAAVRHGLTAVKGQTTPRTYSALIATRGGPVSPLRNASVSSPPRVTMSSEMHSSHPPPFPAAPPQPPTAAIVT